MGCVKSKVVPVKDELNVQRMSSMQSNNAASTLRQGLVTLSSEHTVQQDYELGRTLGTGGTSTVRLAKSKINGRDYALKTISLNRMSSSTRRQLLEEVKIMRQMDHPYIIKIVATYMDLHSLYIVMELCTGGELFDLLYEQPGTRFDEHSAKELVKKMLSAINCECSSYASSCLTATHPPSIPHWRHPLIRPCLPFSRASYR